MGRDADPWLCPTCGKREVVPSLIADHRHEDD